MATWKAIVGRLVGRFKDRRRPEFNTSLPIGVRGEVVAARELRRKGYRIIASSERGPTGEIDLIALDDKTLVFVEVKTLASQKPGHPADRVDLAKQRRITRAAIIFLKQNRLLEHRARFDVVAVWWPKSSPQPTKIQHYINAFDAQGDGQWFC